MPREKQRDEREDGDERERAVVAAETAPRRAGVDPMDEFEESRDENSFVADVERAQHEPFGELVEREDDQRERGDAAVRFFKKGIFGGAFPPKTQKRNPKTKQPRGFIFFFFFLVFDFLLLLKLERT